MKRVGLTGNIGSGKSYVAMIFQNLGVPVFNADIAGHHILNSSKVIEALHNRFGDSILNSSTGLPDRKSLSEKVFGNQENLVFINNLIHPEVRKQFALFALNHNQQKYVLYEAAIIFETGYYKNLDAAILVVANEQVRIKRVTERDGNCETMVKQRISSQLQEVELIKLADYVIKNDGDAPLLEQVLMIHSALS